VDCKFCACFGNEITAFIKELTNAWSVPRVARQLLAEMVQANYSSAGKGNKKGKNEKNLTFFLIKRLTRLQQALNRIGTRQLGVQIMSH
jgi:hypothetical protein